MTTMQDILRQIRHEIAGFDIGDPTLGLAGFEAEFVKLMSGVVDTAKGQIMMSATAATNNEEFLVRFREGSVRAAGVILEALTEFLIPEIDPSEFRHTEKESSTLTADEVAMLERAQVAAREAFGFGLEPGPGPGDY